MVSTTLRVPLLTIRKRSTPPPAPPHSFIPICRTFFPRQRRPPLFLCSYGLEFLHYYTECLRLAVRHQDPFYTYFAASVAFTNKSFSPRPPRPSSFFGMVCISLPQRSPPMALSELFSTCRFNLPYLFSSRCVGSIHVVASPRPRLPSLPLRRMTSFFFLS